MSMQASVLQNIFDIGLIYFSNAVEEHGDHDLGVVHWQSVAMEKDETRRLFEWINRNDTGYLSHAELRVLILILGLKTNTRGLEESLRAIDPKGDGHIDFEKFWGWWSNNRRE